MKPTTILLTWALVTALSIPVAAQHTHEQQGNPKGKTYTVESMMGKPALKSVRDGVTIKVWLMLQEEHKEHMKANMSGMMKEGKADSRSGQMMGGMNHEGKEMDHSVMESMMSGTHHIIVTANRNPGGEDFEGGKTTIRVFSPSGDVAVVELKPMMSRYGGGLRLNEKGEYILKVEFVAGDIVRAADFRFTVN